MIETYDQIIIREDGEAKELDCHVTDDGRVLLRRHMGARAFAEVREYLSKAHGVEVCPLESAAAD